MKNVIVLLFLLVITFSMAKGQEINEEVLDNELVLKSINDQTGLTFEHSTSDDNWVLSGAYNINGDLFNAVELSGFEASLAKKMDRYYLDFYAGQLTTKIEEIASINESAFSDQNIDLENDTISITQFGVGLKLRSTLIQDFINSPSYFDTISSHLVYVSTSIGDASFSGYGLKASYGIYKRMTPSFQMGLKADYHLNVFKRELEEGQTISDSFVATWVTLGFEASIYF